MSSGKLIKILFWTLGIATFIVVILLLAQRFMGPQVKKIFVTEINKSLVAQVEVDDVQLSLIKDFPFASVRFTGVRMKEAVKNPSKEYLLNAGTISLRFNIWDLIRKKYKVKIIRFADVEIKPHVFSDGNDNFHFWKQTTTSGSTDFNFELQRIVLHNIHIVFKNDASKTIIDAHLPVFVANGNFGKSKYDLTLAGNAVLHRFNIQSTEYSGERTLSIWLALEANNQTGLFQITEGRIEAGKLQLKADGSMMYNEAHKTINLSLSATGSTLEEMISLVPQKYLSKINRYSFKGKAAVNSEINGVFGNGRFPAINVRVETQDGSISEKSSGIALRDVSAIAAYTVKQDGKNEMLSISNLKAKLGDGFINGSLVMHGFSSPHLQSNINASMSLNEVQQFLNFDFLSSMHGWIKLNAAFDGTIQDISHPTATDFLTSNFTGSGLIQQADIQTKEYGLPFKNVNSEFTFNGNDLQLKQLIVQVGNSDFALKGVLSNLLTWLFVKNESLGISGSLVSKRFDWDELSGAQKGTGKGYSFRLPEDIDISKLLFRCTNFTFSTFSAANVAGSLQLHNKVLSASDISMLTSQGKVTGQFTINAQPGQHSLLQAKARLDKVNVKSLFTQFGNFGQNDLVADNLEGLITSDVVFAAVMLNNLDIDLNSIKTHADITIENGRLVNYHPMQSLSSFLRVEDLADIRFQTLQNQIDIANQVIFIPSMQVKSSALDLELMGTHTFDNELDYHFVIALADLLAAKYKRKNLGIDNQAEFGPIEDDARGKTKLFVSLTGTVDNPIVKYDKKAVRQKITNELQQQKVELKQILKQEFRLFSADSTKKMQQKKDKEIIKKQEEGKFVIEWDDDKK